jgi:hypothetical protein
MNISTEELRLVITVGKVAVFPVVGFIAGFFVKWFLQNRKSRDELLRALAINRANAFQALWQRLILPHNIRHMKDYEIVPSEFLKGRNEELLEWYYQHANALLLSWRSTKRLFIVLDILRTESPHKEKVRKAFSSLRTALKRDCGIYTSWDAWRQLPPPRSEPWQANNTNSADAKSRAAD